MKIKDELINKIEEITMTDYGWHNGVSENLDIVIEDLIIAYESLLEEYNDYKTKYYDLYYHGKDDDEDMIL